MQAIDIEKIILEKNPGFLKNTPAFFKKMVFGLIARILHLNEINRFLEVHNNKYGIDFIDELLEMLDYSYLITSKDREKIPSESKLIIIANHPLGGLDGLALIKLISEIRADVKIVVNDLLLNIDNLKQFFLPLNILNKTFQKENIGAISQSIQQENAVIIFPAGEVARMGIKGIRDGKWNKGAIYFAEKFNAPVLPVFIEARNSLFFYLLSLIHKQASMFLLPNELFNKRGKSIRIKVGDHILPRAISTKYQRSHYLIKSLKKHVYLIGRNKSGVFATEKNVIHPVSRKIIRNQLTAAEPLGVASDGKKIFLTSYHQSPEVLKEVARLREITFRRVGEGTGRRMDLDGFDKYYDHLILWDEKELEIVGSYRIGNGEKIYREQSIKGFYTSTLFTHSQQLETLLPCAIELGRSFVQAKYWNTVALDYLWQGLGKYLLKHRQIRYLFGGVSLSSTYSEDARNRIVYFYRKWFGSHQCLSQAKNRYQIPDQKAYELQTLFHHADYASDMKALKSRLKLLGNSIPTLYKQYGELCEPGGTLFMDFGIDKGFQNCVDALILVDLTKLKASKRQRYLSDNPCPEKEVRLLRIA